MGVKGLWQLLLPIGRRISIESLEGKILAIDASIWLTQFLKAMRDPDTGRVQNAAHLIGFLRRLCRLRFHGIRPVVVFDGPTPEIKKRETARRRARREQFAKLDDAGVQKMARRLLAQNLQEQKIQRENKNSAVLPAMAPGFNAQGQSTAVTAANEEENQESRPQEEDVKMPAKRSRDEEPTVIDTVNDEAIAVALAEEEYKKAEDENDWAVTKSISLDVEKNNSSHSESYNDDDESNASSDRDEETERSMTVDKIAALSPNRRKDAIELVKRQQRMRSRREFMPAAADPGQFSSVQVTNFLRSTALNKGIHDMAVKEVANKEMKGEAATSTNNSRILLVRDQDEEKKDVSSPQVTRRSVPFRNYRNSSFSGDEEHVQDSWYSGKRAQLNSHLRVQSFDTSNESASETEDSDDDDPETSERSMSPHAEKASETDLPNETVDQCQSHRTHDAFGTVEFPAKRGLDNTRNHSDVPTTAQTRNLPTIASSDGDSDSDSHVNWEEGAASIEESDRVPGSLAEKMEASTRETKKEGRSDVGNTVVVNVGGATSDKSQPSNIRDHEVSPSKSYSAETAAALARAEGTASNLANWAGRAFRRAMKEVGQETIGVTETQPIVPETTKKAVEDGTISSGPRQDVAIASKPPDPEIMVTSKEKSSVPAYSPFFSDNNPMKYEAEAEDPMKVSGGISDISADAVALIDGFNEEWKKERNQRERDMDTISDEMKLEVYQLLELFGVPYVEAPAEAEAQCATLEELKLVDGTVTEDSDIFVFGGQTVYKNIFADKMYAEAYVAKDADREMRLNRNAFVALAMLLGSDYTEGVKGKNLPGLITFLFLFLSCYCVKGVGIVNAMEVLKAFDVTHSTKDGLTQFREWLDGFDPFDEGTGASGIEIQTSLVREFHSKHKTARTRWTIPETFPAENVLHAFAAPVVDRSTQKFSWGVPDLENLAKVGRELGLTWMPSCLTRASVLL